MTGTSRIRELGKCTIEGEQDKNEHTSLTSIVVLVVSARPASVQVGVTDNVHIQYSRLSWRTGLLKKRVVSRLRESLLTQVLPDSSDH